MVVLRAPGLALKPLPAQAEPLRKLVQLLHRVGLEVAAAAPSPPVADRKRVVHVDAQAVHRSGSATIPSMDERVSDSEREQTVASLKDDLLSGRLTLEEFSERVEHAYDAVVQSDLDRVRSGLPATDALPAERPKRRATRFTVALLGHAVKRGRLNLRRWTFAVGALCDLDLDLRQAEIHGQRTALTVLVVLGNVDVYVPENVNVTVSGLAVVGHRRDWGEDVERPQSPEISVRVISLFGTVDVWRVTADMPGDYGEITRGLQARERALPP